MNERVTKKHIDTTKIRIRIADESELTAESIKDIIEDLVERFDEIKGKLEELTDAVPENISKDVYDKWDDALDDIGEYLDEIESLIEEVEENEDEE